MAKERDFLNRKEIELTAIVLASKGYMECYQNCEYLNEFEQRKLKNAIRNIQEMQDSILNRTERVYLKRLKSVLDNNDLNFTPTGLNRTQMVECVDNDVVMKLIKDSGWIMDCVDCERADYAECDCYKIMASVGVEISNKKGCPFK